MFHRYYPLALLGWVMTTAGMNAAEPDSRLYDLRIYSAAEGKLEALHNRFRDHTLKLFEKHGMTNIGYWTPEPNEQSQLIYFLAYPDRAARDQSWRAFLADPQWQAAYKASELDGKLVAKVESRFLQATDYSPAIGPDARGNRVFELRTYKTEPGRLEALHARFREHTLGLFAKHGMTHVAYWSPVAGSHGAEDTLLYILAHDSREAARASFDAFRRDPDWIRVRAASEEGAAAR